MNFKLFEVVYEWANQKKFVEVKMLTETDEGQIIKLITTLQRLCTSVQKAAKIMGDMNLAARMDECENLIMRDIIFTKSLYLD